MSGGGGSGSGSGYSKYQCIYWYEQSCGGWVWQNGDACTVCLSKGLPSKRDSAKLDELSPQFGRPFFPEHVHMSGEGGNGGEGYNKFSCIYRIEFECPYFVWQNGDACTRCLALGRPSKRNAEHVLEFSPFGVPVIENGQVAELEL